MDFYAIMLKDFTEVGQHSRVNQARRKVSGSAVQLEDLHKVLMSMFISRGMTAAIQEFSNE